MEKKPITVKVSYEYEIDISMLDPKFVDINGFAIEYAQRCMTSDLKDRIITAADFDYEIVESNDGDFEQVSHTTKVIKED